MATKKYTSSNAIKVLSLQILTPEKSSEYQIIKYTFPCIRYANTTKWVLQWDAVPDSFVSSISFYLKTTIFMNKILLFSTLIVSTVLISCKKDKIEEPITPPVTNPPYTVPTT